MVVYNTVARTLEQVTRAISDVNSGLLSGIRVSRLREITTAQGNFTNV